MAGFKGFGVTKKQADASAISNRFTTIITLLASQDTQTDRAIFMVLDATIDPTVDVGFALYEFLGNATGDLADYRKLSEEESLDIIPKTKLSEFENDTNFVNQTKLDAIPQFPAPHLEELIPDSYLPNNTGNFILKGSFFTEDMTAIVEGQVINNTVFINSNEFHINMTTGAVEGNFNVSLDNGTAVTFVDALFIVDGTVFKPLASDWELGAVQLDVSEGDMVYTNTLGVVGVEQWAKELDHLKDWSLRFNIGKSPLGFRGLGEYHVNHWKMVRAVDNTLVYGINLNIAGDGMAGFHGYNPIGAVWHANMFHEYSLNPDKEANFDLASTKVIEYRLITGVLYIYYNNVLKKTIGAITEPLKFNLSHKEFDTHNIKLVEY